MSTSQRVAIIGGGLGGLAAACTLAARGHDVTIFEANPWLGGKAAVLSEGGFRFDMGPTILTVPRVLARIFSEAGRRMEDYLDLIPLDPQWRCFFDDGSVLDHTADRNRMRESLKAFSIDPKVAQRYADFIDYSARLHGISERFFFWRSIGSIRDMMDAKSSFNLSTLKDVLAMRMGRSVASTVRSYVDDARVAQMIDHFTQYVGSSPEASPAVLCGIAHMQTHDGVWYPRGGTRAIPEALEKLAAELGVVFVTRAKVGRIEHDGRRVTGLTLETGEHHPADAVISNMDSVRTYRELIGGTLGASFDRKRRYEPACSGVVLYLGLRKRYGQVLHHNFIFSRDPAEEFKAIYEHGEPAADPTCYVAAPAATEPNVAPPGGEALYVLVHTPYLRPGQRWSKMLPAYRRVILDKLRRTAGMPDIEDRVVVERTLTPQDIHDRYHVLNGAIYGLASHGRFFGAFKPANRRQDLRGLYLAGGAAHPGPGMPMVLMSGWIAADSLDTDHGGTTRRLRNQWQPAPSEQCFMSPDAAQRVPVISPLMWRWFSWYAARFLKKHFHAVRLDTATAIPDLANDEPVIFYCNHPSWWDPMVGIVLASKFWSHRKHYWPIDAAMLKKYRFLDKLGFFGVDSSSRRGAAGFLRTASALLSGPNCIWVTAQGEFADARRRPLGLKPGVARLCEYGSRGRIIPVAVEYPFWTEKTPEALLRFGESFQIADRPTLEHLESRLTETMDALAASAKSRDACRFNTLLGGTSGTTGIYDIWRRLGAAFKGRRFSPSHLDDPASLDLKPPEAR